MELQGSALYASVDVRVEFADDGCPGSGHGRHPDSGHEHSGHGDGE